MPHGADVLCGRIGTLSCAVTATAEKGLEMKVPEGGVLDADGEEREEHFDTA